MGSNWLWPSRAMPYRPVNDNIADNSITLAFPVVTVVVVLLPLVALVVCIMWSLVYDFEISTSTHCGVNNWLPSISAAIGSFAPQKYIWRLAISLHSLPRYVIAFMYYNRYGSRAVFVLNILEISSLLGLTYVSSTENFPFHSNCFQLFLISAFVGMGLHLIKYRKSVFKKYMALTNVISGAFAVYFYFRHNWHCEAGIYTLFAICEYLVVLSNILFHFQAFYDFSQTIVSITDRRYHSINYSA